MVCLSLPSDSRPVAEFRNAAHASSFSSFSPLGIPVIGHPGRKMTLRKRKGPMMKATLLLIPSVFFTGSLLAPSAFAADVTVQIALAASPITTTPAISRAISRDEVRALARYAEQHGLIPRGQANWPIAELPAASRASRATINAETRAALAAGIVPRGEAQSSKTVDAPSTLDRASVKAETREALQRGLIPRGEASTGYF